MLGVQEPRAELSHAGAPGRTDCLGGQSDSVSLRFTLSLDQLSKRSESLSAPSHAFLIPRFALYLTRPPYALATSASLLPAALSPPSPTERRVHPSRARAADSTHVNTAHNDRTLDI